MLGISSSASHRGTDPRIGSSFSSDAEADLLAMANSLAVPECFPEVFMGDNGDDYVRCSMCGYGGCDVRVSGCGCTLHAVSEVARTCKILLSN